MKRYSKRAFSLMEIIVIVVIISILLAIGIGLNRDSLERLKIKAVNEEFSGFFDTIFLQVNASNYQNGLAYTGIELSLQTGANQIWYTYQLENSEFLTWVFAWTFEITGLSGDQATLEKATVKYKPFTPACELLAGEKSFDQLSFSVRPRGREEACFKLEKAYCKLQALPCK